MDVRVRNYGTVSVASFGPSGGVPGSVTATNSAANGPVLPAQGIGPVQSQSRERALAEVLATNPGKGKLIDIRV